MYFFLGDIYLHSMAPPGVQVYSNVYAQLMNWVLEDMHAQSLSP